MSNEDWQDFDMLADEEFVESAKNKGRKRKWREIEVIKEQRRLRRDLADFEQYSYL